MVSLWYSKGLALLVDDSSDSFDSFMFFVYVDPIEQIDRVKFRTSNVSYPTSK